MKASDLQLLNVNYKKLYLLLLTGLCRDGGVCSSVANIVVSVG